MVGTAYEDMGERELLSVQSNVVELFGHITTEQMVEFQESDNQIGPILQWVKDGKFPSSQSCIVLSLRLPVSCFTNWIDLS